MNLEELFELIRKEPVCLWVGSGFSLSAGLPGVADLKKHLYSLLTTKQQVLINQDHDLPLFTKNFETLKGRKALLQAVRLKVNIPPTDTYVHDLLSRVAHFKTVITTNYDRVLENSYGPKATVINGNQFLTNGIKRTKIYKIHGDIADPNLVITSTDYSKLYNRDFKEPFWTAFMHEIASHHVIFIGYGYEDPNVWADFDYIESKVTSKNRKRVLISPRISNLKAKDLKQLGIHYIPSNGLDFVSGLIDNVKMNIKNDVEEGFVDIQTAQEFITSFGLEVKFRATEVRTDIIGLKNTKGLTEHKVEFTTTNQEIVKKYKDFTSSYHHKELAISSEDLDNFLMLIEGFGFMDKKNLAEFRFMHLPKFDGKIAVRFEEKAFEIRNIKCKLFNTISGKVLIELSVYGFSISLNLEWKDQKIDMNFSITEPDELTSIVKSHAVFRALYYIFSGDNFEIIVDKGNIIPHHLKKHPQVNEFYEKWNLYHALIRIQNYFKIKFRPVGINDITEDDLSKINKLIKLIDYQYHAIRDPGGLVIQQMPDDPKLFEFLSQPMMAESHLILAGKKKEIDLFGQKIKLGAEHITLKQPRFKDLIESDLTITLLPVDDIIIYQYDVFGVKKWKETVPIWPPNQL